MVGGALLTKLVGLLVSSFGTGPEKYLKLIFNEHRGAKSKSNQRAFCSLDLQGWEGCFNGKNRKSHRDSLFGG